MKIETALTTAGFIPGISVIAGSVQIAIGVHQYVKSSRQLKSYNVQLEQFYEQGLEAHKSNIVSVNQRLAMIKESYLSTYYDAIAIAKGDGIHSSKSIEQKQASLEIAKYVGKLIGIQVNEEVICNESGHLTFEIQTVQIEPEEFSSEIDIDAEVQSAPEVLRPFIRMHLELLKTQNVFLKAPRPPKNNKIRDGISKIFWPVFPISQIVKYASRGSNR